MDITLFNKKLSKISVIIDSVSDGSDLSPLERDLLLSYIRDIYDIALDGKPAQKTNPQVVVNPQAPSVKVLAPIVTEPVVKTPEPVVEKIIEPIAIEPVKVEAVVESPIIESPAVAEGPREIMVPPVSEVKQQDAPTNTSSSKLNISSLHPDVQELFEEEKINDLSDKLSLTPIKDLTRSMGINERVHTQSELFANNSTHFMEVLDTLNKMDNFDQAANFIISNLIDKYDWTNDKRARVATQFVKLVRRRYL